MSNVYKNLKIHFGEGNLKSFDTQVAAIKTANPLLPTDLKKDLLLGISNNIRKHVTSCAVHTPNHREDKIGSPTEKSVFELKGREKRIIFSAEYFYYSLINSFMKKEAIRENLISSEVDIEDEATLLVVIIKRVKLEVHTYA